MPRSNVAVPVLKPALVSVAAAPATSTTAAFALGLADTYSLYFTIATATGTSPTIDVVLQTSIDGGTTYVDLPLRYTQKTAAGTAVLVFKCGLGNNEVAIENAVADTGGTLAKNCVFDWRFMKAKYTIAGTNPAFTFTLNLIGTPSNWNNS